MPPENRLPIPEDEAVWETQVNFPGARLDMVATWEGATLIFEHKVHAVLTDRQITRYRQVADDAFGEVKSCVVAIVALPGQYSAEADACLCWSHVYE
ncbi:PD-(D/E)XK nuclease family protein, partial [Staphylococcus aureus]|uniref:PD-(D/E)XK nuclease family protein n=1 Tax=Staphylococcus aureus TaxID=1280 RepID=UPI00301C7799